MSLSAMPTAMSRGMSDDLDDNGQPLAVRGTLRRLRGTASSSREESMDEGRPDGRDSGWVDRMRTVEENGNEASGAAATSAMNDVDWMSSLAARTPIAGGNGTLRLKKTSTFNGRTASLMLRGTVLDLKRSIFSEFPSMKFREFPKCNLELSKEQLKQYKKIREQLVREREQLVLDREQLLSTYRARDEVLTTDFQAEINRRGQARLKDFQKRQQTVVRERREANDPIPSEQLARETESFESSLASELEQYQVEHEHRLMENRLRWVMPFFQMLKASEFLQYTRLHQLEFYFLEETQAADRGQLEENHMQMNRLDVKGFDKELKGTIKNRKRQHKPMGQEEIDTERERFQQQQNDRFDELARRLDEDHLHMREILSAAQQKQLQELTQYYIDLEASIRSDTSSITPAQRAQKGTGRSAAHSAV